MALYLTKQLFALHVLASHLLAGINLFTGFAALGLWLRFLNANDKVCHCNQNTLEKIIHKLQSSKLLNLYSGIKQHSPEESSCIIVKTYFQPKSLQRCC